MADNVEYIGDHLGNYTVKQLLEILQKDMNEDCDIVVLGYGEDGKYFQYSSDITKREVLWILENAKIELLGGRKNV